MGEVRQAMASTHRTVPEGFLYDAPGLALLERVGSLPSYGMARAEATLLAASRCAIWNAAGCPVDMVEFDAGTAVRSRPIIDLADRYAVADRCRPVLIDTVAGLEKAFPRVAFQAFHAGRLTAAKDLPETDAARLYLWLGSAVARLAPTDARLALAGIRAQMKVEDRLLVTADLAKHPDDLRRAYRDDQGFHAPLVRNALRRLNREIQTSFEIANWIPEIEVQEDRGRVELRLRSSEATEVSGGRTGDVWRFEADEPIVVEHAYKQTEGQVAALFLSAGFRTVERWIEPTWDFGAFLVAP